MHEVSDFEVVVYVQPNGYIGNALSGALFEIPRRMRAISYPKTFTKGRACRESCERGSILCTITTATWR
jgi:hypothetical protein